MDSIKKNLNTISVSRKIARRTGGQNHGAITRLMSPSDFGKLLKPFVFLDQFDHQGEPVYLPLHPHSGIATLTYVAEGGVSYTDPDGTQGALAAGGVEWMQAGGGMWHGGGIDQAGRTRGVQLWIALPPRLELGPHLGLYQAPQAIQRHGPARVLLGGYGKATSAIEAPSSINYLAVRLKAGESWSYQPPKDHRVLWVSVLSGTVTVPDELHSGELAAFEPSSQSVLFIATTDVEFVLGSAVPHDHDLFLGRYSVHTSSEALRAGEAKITEIRRRLIQEGRL
jgi:redox-sensitive bicupin YhaK (pirin superfamily)